MIHAERLNMTITFDGFRLFTYGTDTFLLLLHAGKILRSYAKTRPQVVFTHAIFALRG